MLGIQKRSPALRQFDRGGEAQTNDMTGTNGQQVLLQCKLQGQRSLGLPPLLTDPNGLSSGSAFCQGNSKLTRKARLSPFHS